MNAGTCWEQEYNRPNGLSVQKATFTFTFIAKCNQHTINLAVIVAFGVKQGYSRKKSL